MNTRSDLDETLLAEFIRTFYGYGDYQGPYWFVGMEEGGGNTLAAIRRRITLWQQRGRHELEDVAGYHLALDYPWYFTSPTIVQPTWNKLIRMVLSASQPDVSLDQVKAYQREALGRWHHETCLLELLPLPSPSTGNWLYEAFATVPGLGTRQTYRETYARQRADHLRERIRQHHPATVVFYSVNAWYLEWWRAIANVDLEVRQMDGVDYHVGSDAHTRYLVVHHPASRGITHNYYHGLGRLMGQNEDGRR